MWPLQVGQSTCERGVRVWNRSVGGILPRAAREAVEHPHYGDKLVAIMSDRGLLETFGLETRV
jgi:hypothetical protein